MHKVTIRERFRYRFDNIMARGPAALVALLALLSAAIVLALSFVVWRAKLAPPADDGARPRFIEIVWMSLMRTLDAGTMGGDAGSWPFLIAMLAVTFGGIFVISTFIGVLTSGIEGRLEELRKGRSKVVESGHTVILGWSPQVFNVVSELILANESRRNACIVILGQKDKVEMQDELAERIGDFKTTRIVCRAGDPIEMTDLEIASVQTSRSIIVLGPESEDADSTVIKTLLALVNSPSRRKEKYHIVAEIQHQKNVQVAKLVGKDEVEVVLAGDLISRITVQTCRQSGLSVVYTELLDFGGDEIYFHEEPALVGKTITQALFAYEDSAVMGVFSAKHGSKILPPLETKIEPGDKLIVVAEDDDAVKLSGKTSLPVQLQAIREAAAVAAQPETSLILGWNARLITIVRELDKYVAPGSMVTVVADKPDGEEELMRACRLERQRLAYSVGDITDRELLESLNPDAFDHIILLSADDVSVQTADARTLVTLLHLRDMADQRGKKVSIVSEMLDIRNRDLAQVTRADDFIVSDKLVGLMMTQISENKHLSAVFADLFDPEGAEIYLKPAESYVANGVPLSFYTVVEAARRRGEIAIGYRLLAKADDPNGHGVVVNPEKSVAVTFSPGDKVIVLAES